MNDTLPPTLLRVLPAIALTLSASVGAAEATKAAAKPPPFSCSAAAQDDWIGKRNPYQPQYNAHDALGLPDWVSFSVENRMRYETMDGQFRSGGAGGDQAMPMQTCAWLELRHNGFRVGTEFLDSRQFFSDAGSRINGTTPVNNTEMNEADFLQIYGAWSGENVMDSGVDVEVKLGRQTLDLGSRRLIGRNVFRNTINSFTGALFRFRDSKDQWQLRLFGVQPVERYPVASQDLLNGRHRFDEEAYRTYLGGGMMEWFDVAYKVNAETYLYYLNEEDRPGEVGTANRELYTPGVRFYRQPAKSHWDFEVETIAQVGNSHASTKLTDYKTLDNKAWFQHAQVGYTFDLPWKPRLLGLYDWASGDHNNKDGVNGRFDTLYGTRRGDLGPTGILGLFARGNINSPGSRLLVNPHPDVSAFVTHRLVWLADRKDQWIGTGLQDSTGKSGDFLGHLVEASARWDVNSNLALETGWTRLIKGGFAKNAPKAPKDQGDVDYFYVQSLVRF